jgi:hypothetical protein
LIEKENAELRGRRGEGDVDDAGMSDGDSDAGAGAGDASKVRCCRCRGFGAVTVGDALCRGVGDVSCVAVDAEPHPSCGLSYFHRRSGRKTATAVPYVLLASCLSGVLCCRVLDRDMCRGVLLLLQPKKKLKPGM